MGQKHSVPKKSHKDENKHDHPPSASPHSQGVESLLFGKVRRDVADVVAGLDSNVRQYISEVKHVQSVADWISLNKQLLGDPLGGVDKSDAKLPISPHLQFATGTMFGFCSGLAARKAFRLGAVIVGAGFISLQLLQYYGYVTVEWKTIEKEITSRLDLNKDGRLDEKDLEILKQHATKMLTWGLPCAGGFGTGFLLGLRGRLI